MKDREDSNPGDQGEQMSILAWYPVMERCCKIEAKHTFFLLHAVTYWLHHNYVEHCSSSVLYLIHEIFQELTLLPPSEDLLSSGWQSLYFVFNTNGSCQWSMSKITAMLWTHLKWQWVCEVC
jgi:hypothetical protein